ncbi:MAG: DUF4179 domain-containing protein [Oscillospiraceae bacterium]|nr:DUF4179 domain-containing protein [Oscillospiraceae bacterium]
MSIKWCNVFPPEVPGEFHNSVLNTLETQTKQPVKKERVKIMKFKTLIAAVVAVVMLGAISVGAYTLINGWNPKMAEIFDADEQTQEKLTNNGMSKVVNLSDTNNGVTLDVVQTVADANMAYILLRFSSENERLLEFEGFNDHYSISDRFHIEGYMDSLTPKEKYNGERDFSNVFVSSMSSGIVEDSMETVIDENGKTVYQFYYGITIMNDNQQDYNNRVATVKFKDIGAYEGKLEGYYNVIEGEWEVSWLFEYQDYTKTYELNKSIDVNGVEVIVKSVEISPLALNIVIDGDSARALHQNALEVYPHLETQDFADINNILNYINFLPVYKNGEVFDDVSSMGSMGGMEEYAAKKIFNRILDIDNVTGIYAQCISYPEYEFEFSLVD